MRVCDEFVELLDMRELGIIVIRDKVGNPQYDPKTMLKLIIYAYSYGWRSSRKIERALYHNLSFMWLTGGLKPDHKTISKFRSDNKDALKKVLKQCVKICMDLKLIEGNTLFIDGSKIRANASIKEIWTEDRCEEFLKKLDSRIEEILTECETADKNEEGTFTKIPEELIGKRRRRSADMRQWRRREGGYSTKDLRAIYNHKRRKRHRDRALHVQEHCREEHEWQIGVQ
ncbi:MAG: transposase [Nitrospirae bacterium]|nr:transposase [Nitrospirota bacterium]